MILMRMWCNGSHGSLRSCFREEWGFESLHPHQRLEMTDYSYIPVYINSEIVYILWHDGIPCPLRVRIRTTNNGHVYETESGIFIK